MKMIVLILGLMVSVWSLNASAQSEDRTYTAAVNTVRSYFRPGMNPVQEKVINDTLVELAEAFESPAAVRPFYNECGLMLEVGPKQAEYDRIVSLFKIRFRTAVY